VKRIILVAAIAASASSLSLGIATAHADEVKPGLACDDFGGVFKCDNSTDVDYTVTQKRAHNTGWGGNNCGHFDPTRITYSIEPVSPPAP
jgi:hypothetical protein